MRAECACPRDASGKIVTPGQQSPRVRRETGGRGGKAVTVISGLDPVATDLNVLAKDLRSRLGAGGTVTDGKIEIQGDHRDRVVEMLKSLGYAAKPSGG